MIRIKNRTMKRCIIMFVILVSALFVAVLLEKNNLETFSAEGPMGRDQAVNHMFE